MILHITVMVLAISLLAGITFEYDVANKETEVIILVDTSDSGNETADDKDDFVQSIINNTDSMANDVGTILGGSEAVECGMIDSVGGLSDALEALHGMIAEKST